MKKYLLIALAALVVFSFGRKIADAQTAAPQAAPDCSFPKRVGRLVSGGLYQGSTNQASYLVFEDSAGTIRAYKGCELFYKFDRQ